MLLVSALAATAAVQACTGGIDRSPAAGTPEAMERGAILFARNCQVCHGDKDGAGVLPGVPVHNERGHTWHHPDAQLKEWTLEGKGAMPGFGDRLTEEEVEAILDFIKTWWTEEQRETQADISRRYQEALDRQLEEQ